MLPAKAPDRFRSASEALPRLALLGPAELSVAGRPVGLPPKTLAVLVRLALASGDAVPVEQIFRDVWQPARSAVGRPERTCVQQRITELRRAIVGAKTGSSPLIVMERSAQTSSYRLTLGDDRIDVNQFSLLVEQAASADAVGAVDLLRRALALWRGRPLQDIEHLPFARAHIDRLTALRYDAMRDLVSIYRDLGQTARAFSFAKELASIYPEDEVARVLIAEIQASLRRSRRGLIHRTFGGEPPVNLTIMSGDILDEADAHLVIGFCDTFDTDTAADLVINSNSLQARAAQRLFDGNRPVLDRQLRAALRHAQHTGRETRQSKRHGKLLRYPIGTVAVLRHAGRCLFALAYSRMGNDLVARSTRADIQASLENLWEAVYLHGQLRPVAIPLIGTGLSRIEDAGRAGMLRLIAESFLTRTRAGRISSELRIVLRPDQLAALEVIDLARQLEQLWPPIRPGSDPDDLEDWGGSA